MAYAELFPDEINFEALLRPGNHLVGIDGFWAAYFGQTGLLEFDGLDRWFVTTEEQIDAVNRLVGGEASWYRIVVPIGDDRELSVVYRNWEHDPGIDYVESSMGAVGGGRRLAFAEGVILEGLGEWEQVAELIHGAGAQPSGLSLAERTLLLFPTYLAGHPDPDRAVRQALVEALMQVPYVRHAHSLADALLGLEA